MKRELRKNKTINWVDKPKVMSLTQHAAFGRQCVCIATIRIYQERIITKREENMTTISIVKSCFRKNGKNRDMTR